MPAARIYAAASCLPGDVELAGGVTARGAARVRDARRVRAAQFDGMAKISCAAGAKARRRCLAVIDLQQAAGLAQRLVAGRAEILIGMVDRRRLSQKAVE